MLLLALDTSTRQASVSLSSEDALLGEYTWHVGNNHSVELLERVQRLFDESAKSMTEIDGIAVAIGPGSFNGVRVAVATAKTFAFTLQKPLIGVGTLDIIAAQQHHWRAPICSILEAGRSELYAACYLNEEVYTEQGEASYRTRRLSEYLLLAPQELCDFLLEKASEWVGIPGERNLPPFLFCGEISEASRLALRERLSTMSLFIGNASESARRASTLALLAQQRFAEGMLDNPLVLEPLYVRRPSITTSARKQPLLGGSTASATPAAATADRPDRPAGAKATGPSHTEREQGALRH
jgi:tRNA threonylcarbamoyladenosine biosynthesis protein TsaB